MTDLLELHQRFREIVLSAYGPTKSRSGNISIHVDMEGEIRVDLGTYDIADWPSETNLGPFTGLEAAYEAIGSPLDEAQEVVQREELDYICLECETVLGDIDSDNKWDGNWCSGCKKSVTNGLPVTNS